MIAPKKYQNEQERIHSLKSFSILDTLPESDYDNLTLLAAEICDTPVSFISFIDEERQWFKSTYGVDINETKRDFSFCAHAIHEPNEVFIVPDSRKDSRFHDNPFVKGEPNIVFYAGVPLLTNNGLPIGTLCVVDQKPRELTPKQIRSLKALSEQVRNLLELRINKIKLNKTIQELEDKNDTLEKFAYTAAHDLKSPLGNIVMLIDFFNQNHGASINPEGLEILELVKKSSYKLKEMIHSLLNYSKSDLNLKDNKIDVNLKEFVEEISTLFVFNNNCKISLSSNTTAININKLALDQLMINLVSNAIKYNDKEIAEIGIDIRDENEYYKISVSDNGPGILEEYFEKIFQLFEVYTAEDRFGENGTGIGLALVKKIAESLDGSVAVESEIGKGAKFIVTIKKL